MTTNEVGQGSVATEAPSFEGAERVVLGMGQVASVTEAMAVPVPAVQEGHKVGTYAWATTNMPDSWFRSSERSVA